MARASIIANLGKMLTVQAGLTEGLSVTRACKAADTTSGTYKKWRERYAALGTPVAVAPLSDHGAFHLVDGFLFTADEDEGGLTLTRTDAATAERLTHHIPRPRARHSYRSVVVISAAPTGERALVMLSGGELLWWTPQTGAVTGCDLDLAARGCSVGGRAGSGIRRWAMAAFSPDLTCAAYWQDDRSGTVTLRVVGIDDQRERMSHTLHQISICSAIVFHPTRPLLGVLNTNKLVTLLNYETGEVVVERGPQVHSISFSTGDTLLYDDWYGKTRVFNYVDNTNAHVSAGWGSHASQSSRFLTGSHQGVRLRDTGVPEAVHAMDIDNIVGCALSVDGRILAIQTDHIGMWRIADLTSTI